MNGEPISETRPEKGSDSDARFLDGFPGAALLVDAEARPLAANAKGAGIEQFLNEQGSEEISGLVAKAAVGGAIACGNMTLKTSRGEATLEVTAMPDRDGSGRVLVLVRDLTMERNLRTTLVESRQRYKDLVEISSDFSWEVDSEGRFVFVTPRGALGYKPDELIGRKARDFVVDPDEYVPFPFSTVRPLERVEIWMTNKDDTTSCMVVSSLPLVREEGGGDVWFGCRGVCHDVTEERESEAALARARHREQLLNYIVGQIRDEVQPADMLIAAAAATSRALGAAGSRIFRQTEPGQFEIAAEYGGTEGVDEIAEHLTSLKIGGGVLTFDLGPWDVLVAATHYRSAINGALAMWKPMDRGGWDDEHRLLISDVSNQLGIANEQITNHERIVRLSRTDGMTGLLNRRAFYEEELPRRVARLERNAQTAALFYVDMDNFKRVNDVHGHQAGDDAILFLRDMLLKHSRPGDLVARLGGDEFAMWLDGIDLATSRKRAEQLIDASQEMRRMSGDDEFPLGISVGVAFFDPAGDEGLDELLARADEAMYQVKHGGKGGYLIAERPPSAAGG